MSVGDYLEEDEEVAEGLSPTPVGRVYNPTMGELLSETDKIYSKVTENNNLMSKIEQVTGELEGIAANVSSEGGLTDFSRKVIADTFRAIAGNRVLTERLVALESVDSADDEFKDGVVEEIQDKTLNDFLLALKRSFYDGWGDTKNWYGKIVSIRESLILKNKDTADRATKVKGEPSTTEFIFKDNLDVDSNGKVSHQELILGLEHMLAYTEKRLTAKVDKEFEDFIVGCQRLVDDYKSKNEVDETELLKYKNLYSPPPEVITTPLEDKSVRNRLTDSETAELVQTKRFPGLTYVVISSPGNKSGATPYSFIDDTWVKLYTEPEVEEKNEVRVRTFYPNQIINNCDVISQLMDTLGYFDKSWERRDRFMTKVFASLDKTISVIADKLTDSSIDKKVEEQLRALTRIMIRAIQLDNTFNSVLINHVIKVSAQTTDLNNACLLQYSEE